MTRYQFSASPEGGYIVVDTVARRIVCRCDECRDAELLAMLLNRDQIASVLGEEYAGADQHESA